MTREQAGFEAWRQTTNILTALELGIPIPPAAYASRDAAIARYLQTPDEGGRASCPK
jgi:hypothetical protein